MLDSGLEKNCGLRSISTTSACGASWRRLAAVVRPPQPPPAITTRGALPRGRRVWVDVPMKAGCGAPVLPDGGRGVPLAQPASAALPARPAMK